MNTERLSWKWGEPFHLWLSVINTFKQPPLDGFTSYVRGINREADWYKFLLRGPFQDCGLFVWGHNWIATMASQVTSKPQFGQVCRTAIAKAGGYIGRFCFSIKSNMSMYGPLPPPEYPIMTKPVTRAVTYPPGRRMMHTCSPPRYLIIRKPNTHNLFHILDEVRHEMEQ